jgi:hypothetical protein
VVVQEVHEHEVSLDVVAKQELEVREAVRQLVKLLGPPGVAGSGSKALSASVEALRN